jgi:hypothetical protein
MKIQLSPRYILAFLLLTMLCGLSHEMVHHAAGAAVCGGWGYKTFNSFSLYSPCANEAYSYLATLAGPAFTYALMWLGWYRLAKPDRQSRQLGFALIFANFPVNRMLFVFLGFNDEQYIVRTMFDKSPLASAAAIVIVLLCTVPPLVAAYRAIENKHRVWWFLGFYLLPFVFVILFAGFFLENFLLLNRKVLADTVLGIPYLLLAVEVACIAGYAIAKKYLYIPVPARRRAA